MMTVIGNWLRKIWALLAIVLTASIVCGPAARWLVVNVGPGIAQAALVIDGLASVCLVLIALDFMLDNRRRWGIFPTLDLDLAINNVLNGNGRGDTPSPIGNAILVAAVMALVITVLVLAIPRGNELPMLQPPPQALQLDRA